MWLNLVKVPHTVVGNLQEKLPDHVEILADVENRWWVQISTCSFDWGLNSHDRLFQIPKLIIPLFNRELSTMEEK
jgi:hypothetical protein